MTLKLSAAIETTFILKHSDEVLKNEGEPTTVSIRQATQGDFDTREALLLEFTRVYDGDGVTITQHFSPTTLRKKEVEMTLAGCNILLDGDKPLFTFHNGVVDSASFNKGWAMLPPVVANEIYEKVLEMNPMWQTGGVGEAY
jgi:hypothetical protein